MYIDVTESDYYLGFKGLKSVIFPQKVFINFIQRVKKAKWVQGSRFTTQRQVANAIN